MLKLHSDIKKEDMLKLLRLLKDSVSDEPVDPIAILNVQNMHALLTQATNAYSYGTLWDDVEQELSNTLTHAIARMATPELSVSLANSQQKDTIYKQTLKQLLFLAQPTDIKLIKQQLEFCYEAGQSYLELCDYKSALPWFVMGLDRLETWTPVGENKF